MKTWKIPVTWEMGGIVEVEANTLEDAMDIARDDNEELPLPDSSDSIYIDGSWSLSFNETDTIRKYYNSDQSDETED